MKIMFIAPANSIHTVRWVNALAERGNEVHLVSLPNHQQEQDKIVSNVFVHYLSMGGTKGYYLDALEIRKLAKKMQPDVINAHYASGYGTLVRIARLPKVILSVWGSDVYDFPYEGKLKKSIIKRNLNYATKIASTSKVMAEQVCCLIGNREISVTPFGVDTEHFKKVDIKEKGIFTVGIVKTLAPKYGIDTVIRAFDNFLDLAGNGVKARLLIYGCGEQKIELSQLCKELNISSKVFFEGYIPNWNVPSVLNRFDIACFGSRSESFGVSAVEAMACEIPVIATKVAGFQEVVRDGETGILVDVDDAQAMADAMKKLYDDKELREQYGKAGRKRVQNLYNWNENVDEMITLYRNVSK